MKLTKKNPVPRFRTALALSLLLGACSSGYSQDAGTDEEIFELSPFEVTASENDVGYYSERTLAGSRLNTKVSDLAASITVVTMQQMQDTASTDINDVFLYESSTEGFGNYTETGGSLADRGTVKDGAAGYSFANTGESSSSGSANRIRGLSGPTNTQNFYPTISGIPFDAYNTRTVEINRGPNSILAGLGSPAGIVNQSTAGASLNNNSTEIVIRFDDRGSMRGSFSHNQSLIEDKLGIFVAGLSDKQKFERKPSYNDTGRFYTAVKYRPFQKTTLTGSYETFSNENRSPNSLTPRDYVTPWLEAGRPAYNPVTRMVTVMDTGATSGPYDINSSSPTYQSGDQLNFNAFASTASRHYVPGIATATGAPATGRPVIMVGQEGYIAQDTGAFWGWNSNSNYPVSQRAPADADRTAADWEIMSRTWTSSYYNKTAEENNISNFVAAPVSDQSIYDWTKYNSLAMNYGSKDGKTMNLELDQELTEDLFLRVGWFRQEYDDIQNYTVQQQTGATLFIDTNSHLVTGEVNPNFGLPYLEDYLPDTWKNSNINDNLRAQIAYELDFTENDGWSKWVGKHNFLGLWSEQKTENLRLRLRGTGVGGDGRYLPWNDLTTTGNWRYYGNSSRIKRSYYLASPGDDYATVTAGAPTHWGQPNYVGVDGVIEDFGGPNSGMVKIWDWETESVQEVPIEWATVLHDATSGRNERTLTSETIGWQGYFLDNRIITTVGLRKDDVDLRNTVGSAGLSRSEFTDKGYVKPEASYDRWSYGDNERNEQSIKGAETKSYGVVTVPLKWEGGDLRVHYNWSDNFNPPTSAETDVFGELLPNPTGVGEDWGISVSALDNKLVAKLNWFENSAENERTGSAKTLLDRLVRVDSEYLKNWAEQIAHMELGYVDYTISEPNRPDLTESQQTALESRVEEITGLPYSFPSGINYSATQSSVAKGMEAQLIYNPTKNWTIKMTAAKNETTTQNVAPQYDAWSAERVGLWQGLTSPLTAANDNNEDGDNNPNTYMFNGLREADLTNFLTAYGYNSTFDLGNDARLWDDVGEFYDEAVLTQVAFAKAMEGVAAPNLRKYRANFVTNYKFSDGKFQGLGLGGSVRWESKSAIGYYGRATVAEEPDLLNAPDPTRPYYDDGNINIDLWASYQLALTDDLDWKLQLNIRNAQDSGELRPIAVDYAGNVSGYRIIDPRQFILTSTFSF